MDRRAFIVIGPESSGTKFLTRLFVKAGCYGDAWHKQRLDTEEPNEPLVVLRRSYPHGGEWPDLREIVERFKGYDVRVILIVRSQQFTVASRRRHAKGDLHGQALEALQRIGSQWWECSVPGAWITYEALVRYPKNTIHWLFGWCGLPIPKGVKIKDGNEKYVGGGK
jgi:hypothetical protein